VPEILIGNSIQILVADDTSVVVITSNIVDSQSNIKAVFEQLNKWFNFNLLPLKLIKLILCILKQNNTHNLDIVIKHNNRCISNTSYRNFLGLTLDNTLMENPYRSGVS
jgi:hypothetical protein